MLQNIRPKEIGSVTRVKLEVPTWNGNEIIQQRFVERNGNPRKEMPLEMNEATVSIWPLINKRGLDEIVMQLSLTSKVLLITGR